MLFTTTTHGSPGASPPGEGMIWIVVAVAGLALLGPILVAAMALRITDRETDGTGYFGRPLAERRAMKERIVARSRWILPLFRGFARLRPPQRLRTIEYKGVTGPAQTVSVALYKSTEAYQPNAGDVFVATQMKCGTTWMQQIVFEVLCRGTGDLSDSGYRHMYAVSPWIESRHSVSMADAPRVGDRKQRIIKTHMPTLLCPYSDRARYVYVTRHPVACFASAVDFVQMLAGPMAPAVPKLLDWYCSDEMWWRSWPEHVDGWWRWAEERPNVLFIHYEDMLGDLPMAVRDVATLLGINLTETELDRITEKSGFAYMKQHEEQFEMSPPSLLTQDDSGSYLKGGTRSRERDVGDAERRAVLQFCKRRLADSPYPVDRFYPDIAGAV